MSETDPALGMLARTFRSFGYRDFRLMWTGAFLSTVGTWMQIIAQAWLVYDLSKSAFLLGLTAFLGELPIILFTLLGGAAADRIDRRKLLLASQYVQMASALFLTAMIVLQMIAIWHFLVMAFLVGTAQAFGGPAYQSLIPGLVKREDLPNAIALNSIQFNLARVIGPILAGLIMDRLGPAVCFGLNGFSFLAVIVSLLSIRSTYRPARSSVSVIQDIGKGLKFLLGHGALWQLSVLGFVSAFCAFPLQTMLPVFAGEVFELDSRYYSYMMACFGVGAVAGALLFAGGFGLKKRGLATLKLQIVFALILVSFSFSRILPLSLLLLGVGGITMMMLIASINSLIQMTASDEMRGRVMSIFMLSFRGGMPLGNLFTGAVARISPTTAILLNGTPLATAALVFLMSSSRVKEL